MSEVSYSNVPPMMAAIRGGDIEALRSLLHAGHSPNEPQCYQVTIGARPREEKTSPLELAVLENRMDMVRLLIEAGADLTHNPEELLYGSLRSRDLTLFSFLIHAGVRIPAKQENIYRLFLHLENRRDPDILSILDRLGMDLKQYGGEALRSVASQGNQMLAEYLIQNGADINYHKPDMVFPYASTPVTEAARHNDFSMVRYLVEQGADITISDKYGDRPYTVAVQNKNPGGMAQRTGKGASAHALQVARQAGGILKDRPLAFGISGTGTGKVGGTLSLHGCAGDNLEAEKTALPDGEDGQLQRLPAAVELQGQKAVVSGYRA